MSQPAQTNNEATPSNHPGRAKRQGRAYVLSARELVTDCNEQMRILFDNVKDYALFVLDPTGRIVSWNEGAARETGYSEEEVIGKYYGLLFTPEDQASGVPEWELGQAKRNGCADDTRWLVCKHGTRFWAEGALTAVRNANGELKGFFKVSRDGTDRKRFEQALKEKDDRLQAALAAGRMGTWRWNIDTGADVLDENMAALCGLEHKTTSLTIEEFYALVHESDRASVEDAFERSKREDAKFLLDYRVVWPDGSEHWLTDQWRVCKGSDGQAVCLTGACMDISERKLHEQNLTGSVQEKEILLKEIHHRVKNNLNVITSLLSLQANGAQDPAVVRILGEVQNRVLAIAGLHERLYSSSDLTSIHFGDYMRDLVENLSAVYDISTRHIELNIKAADVVLDVDQALPLGLIVNELVCNAFKHAFPGERTGSVDISLRYAGDEGIPKGCELLVRDNGVGMVGEFTASGSMGGQVVSVLVQQIHGTLKLKQDGGTQVTVQFPLE